MQENSDLHALCKGCSACFVWAPQVKEAHGLSLALLVDCLKSFWAYGILPPVATPCTPAATPLCGAPR